jgi:uncharacterized protein YecE (DUF72 family)
MYIMSNDVGIQPALFDVVGAPKPTAPQRIASPIPRRREAPQVQPAAAQASHEELAGDLDSLFGKRWHFGTSSWNFPGWAGIVYADTSPEAELSRHGLHALSRHPLLRSVSLDRAFYRSLVRATYANLAAQVPDTFRFLVKAPASVTDAVVRDSARGQAVAPNPGFLDPAAALAQALEPACAGLGPKLGTLVFQLSPLPWNLLRDAAGPALDRLEAFWSRLMPAVPAGVDIALEVRDPLLLQPALARQLRTHGVRYCLGLHDRMPPIDAQLDMLRALWPGNLVCRWNLQRGLRYTQARGAFTPFDRLQAPDVATRTQLARVIAGTLRAGHRACVTINNKAEGSAPLSVFRLAEAVLEAARSAGRLTAGDPATPATDR